MEKITSFIISILDFFKSTTKKGVYYAELPIKPKLHVIGNNLQIHVENSIKNSSKFIYKVELKVVNTTIKISALQKSNTSSKSNFENDFTFSLAEYQLNIENLKSYQFEWIDPDGQVTALFLN